MAARKADSEDDGQQKLLLMEGALAAAAAGTTGAMLSTVSLYPVELVKNRLQAAALGKSSFPYTSVVDGLLTILREDGLHGLFLGLGPILSRCIVSDFATYFFGDLLLGVSGTSRSSAAALPLKIAGASMSTMLSLPLENISTRVTVSLPPVSAIVATRQLWREGGLASFWRGVRVMQALCINPALSHCCFEWLRSFWIRLKYPNSECNKTQKLSLMEAFAIGAIAKMLTMLFVYPLIRGKFLLQARDTAGAGLFQVLREVYQDTGFRGLYKGLDAQLSKSLLSNALQFATKEQTESRWRSFVLSRRA